MVKRKKKGNGMFGKILSISLGTVFGLGFAVAIIWRSGWGAFIDKLLFWGFGVFFIGTFAFIFIKLKRKKLRRLMR